MQPTNSKGFTLIEVLVALAIVSIGMLVVIQAVSQTASNSGYLRDKTLAHWVAMNQLTLMRLNSTVPTTGSTNGEAEMGGQRWRWTADVSQTAIDSMLRIDIGVRAVDADDESKLVTVTGFVGAKIAKPGILIEPFTPAINMPGAPTTQPLPTPGTTPPTLLPAPAPKPVPAPK